MRVFAPIAPHGHDNVVVMLVKLEDQLNPGNLVGRAIGNSFGGTEEIGGFGGAVNPNAAVFEIQA